MATTIIGSSNNRVTCTVNLILEKAEMDIPMGWVYENGAVIKIEGFGETSRVTMIHPEEVSNPARFVSKKSFNEKFSGELPISKPLGETTYLVRHGHAKHNDPTSTFYEAHDASLTPLGLTQAKNSGKAIFENSGGVLPNLKLKSSDLVRTMQTINELLQELPEDKRTDTCEVCIEARENSRPIGGIHHFKKDDPLTEKAIDPFISVEDLRLLAPGKLDSELERMCIENCPKNDPLNDWDNCTKKINALTIDWSVYKAKLTEGYAAGKNFGQIASEKTLFDIIFNN